MKRQEVTLLIYTGTGDPATDREHYAVETVNGWIAGEWAAYQPQKGWVKLPFLGEYYITYLRAHADIGVAKNLLIAKCALAALEDITLPLNPVGEPILGIQQYQAPPLSWQAIASALAEKVPEMLLWYGDTAIPAAEMLRKQRDERERERKEKGE